jgi:hypothetical protein
MIPNLPVHGFSMLLREKNFSTRRQKKGNFLSQKQRSKTGAACHLMKRSMRVPEDGIFRFIMVIFDHPAP